MKVLFDNFIFQHQTIGGISRYCYKLMLEFKKLRCLDFVFPIYYSLNKYLQNSILTPQMNFYMNSFLCKIGEFRRYLRKKNTKSVIKELKSGKYDIFHPSYFSDYFLDALDKANNTKLVITIHDMVTEAFAENFKDDSLNIAKIKRQLAKRADKIITISEFSKSEILKYYPEISSDKIDVVYHGNSLENIEMPNKSDKYGKYILYVGARKGYKNFLALLNAIAPLLKEKNIKLICASAWDFDVNEQKEISNLDVENLVKNVKCDDKELFELYYNAICCVFPSLYEGFGLPVLEAFALNCPMICSKSASLPEIGADACEYFDGKDNISIYNKVKEVVENDVLRQAMIKKGNERLKCFTWEKTAVDTFEVYKSIVK